MRRTSLNLTPLEDRATPATLAHAAGTLTVTAENLDLIMVNTNVENVPGFLRVIAGPDFFDSGTTQPVRNLVVNAGAAATYTLAFGPNVSLTNVAVRGAATTTTVNLPVDLQLAGNFTFTGGPAGGNDMITVFNGAQVNGNMTLDLGGGTNTVAVHGGRFGGNVKVTAGSGDDTIGLGLIGSITVGGNLSVNLGAGFNRLSGAGPHSVLVGRNFAYTGGTGDDRVDFDTAGAQLRVIGNATADLGGMTGAFIPPVNFWHTGDLTVGRNFSVRGALAVDLDGENFVGGSLTVSATPGLANTLSMGISLAPGANTQSSTINGSLRYNGSELNDTVSLDHLTVRRTLDLRLGAGAASTAYLGVSQNATVLVGGALSLSSAADVGSFVLMRLRVGETTTVRTQGGNDGLLIDDSDFAGAATFDMGAGSDAVRIDVLNADPFGVLLSRLTRFQAALTVYGRAGNDVVSLGDDVTGTGVHVGGPIRLLGGAGTDDLQLRPTALPPAPANNLYLSTSLEEDFETGDTF